MGSFGIGLGSFLGGVKGGMDLGDEIITAGREGKQRRAMDAIDKSARTNFDKDVERGIRTPDSFDRFYTEYAVPKKTHELMLQGDVQGAEAWKTWADSSNAKEGAKLFGNGMIAAQSGDMKGALDNFVKAGRVKGYGLDYDISDPVEVKDDKGNVSGWAISVKNPQGEEFKQTFTDPAQVAKFGAEHTNPDTMWENMRAAEAAATKMKTEIDTDTAKQTTKFNFDVAASKVPGLNNKPADSVAAWKEAREGLVGNKAFDEASPDEQDKMIEARRAKITTGAVGLGAGAPAPAAGAPVGEVQVDTATGQPVQAPVPSPGPQAGAPGVPVAPAPGQQVTTAGTGPLMVEKARAQLAAGAPPDQVRRQLEIMGVPPDQWPKELAAAGAPAPTAQAPSPAPAAEEPAPAPRRKAAPAEEAPGLGTQILGKVRDTAKSVIDSVTSAPPASDEPTIVDAVKGSGAVTTKLKPEQSTALKAAQKAMAQGEVDKPFVRYQLQKLGIPKRLWPNGL